MHFIPTLPNRKLFQLLCCVYSTALVYPQHSHLLRNIFKWVYMTTCVPCFMYLGSWTKFDYICHNALSENKYRYLVVHNILWRIRLMQIFALLKELAIESHAGTSGVTWFVSALHKTYMTNNTIEWVWMEYDYVNVGIWNKYWRYTRPNWRFNFQWLCEVYSFDFLLYNWWFPCLK